VSGKPSRCLKLLRSIKEPFIWEADGYGRVQFKEQGGGGRQEILGGGSREEQGALQSRREKKKIGLY